MLVVIPSTIQVFAWLLDGRDRRAALPSAAALHRRLHRLLRARRPHRDHVRRDPVRPGADRHVLRRRALPLHHLRRRPSSRSSAGSTTGSRRSPAACTTSAGGRVVLGHLRRDDADVLPDAHRRAARDDAARLHVRAGPRLGRVQPGRDDRRLRARSRTAAHPGEPRLEPLSRRAGRAGPVARRHARVDDPLAAAPLQLRGHPDGASAYPNWDQTDSGDDLQRGGLVLDTGTRRPRRPSATAGSRRSSRCRPSRRGRSCSRSASRSSS